jgi:glycosyltransferase involved in cell wall biosynthesis
MKLGLKVLHLIDSGGLYGAERMLLSLVKEQITMGLEPTILSAGELGIPDKPFEVEAKRLGLSLKIWRMKPGFNLKEARKIVHWARHNSIELFHSHGYKFNILLGLLGNGRNVPMISTLHGYVHAPKFSKLWLYELVDRLAIRRMDAVVLVGDAMKRELPNSLISSPKTHTIRNGVCIEDIQAKAKERPPEHIAEFIARHEPIILGVGRLSREKGFSYLVKAFESIRAKRPQAGLLIVGEGSRRAILESAVSRSALTESVLIPGFCCNIPALMSKASILVIPSLTEGLPITLLEAMAIRLPIISSAVGEIPFVLAEGTCGYLVYDVTANNLSLVIDGAINDQEKTLEQRDRAFSRLSSVFSAQAMAEQYQTIYQRVLQ